MILDGKEVAAALDEAGRAKCEELKAKGVMPQLAIVRIGEKAEDVSYERGAVKRCQKVGIKVRLVILPAEITEEQLLDEIRGLNADKAVHGVLLLRPFPEQMRDDVVRDALSPEKDVDGITEGSLAGVFTGRQRGFSPCTAEACMKILEHYGIDPAGKRVTVVGRSLVVGRPAALLLTHKNATVTLCHTKTVDMAARCAEGEILLVAAGRRHVIGEGCFAPGQVVLDVGIHLTEEGKLTGDVDFAAAEPVVKAITPVPGGVGSVTTSVLCAHVLEAACREAGV